eukprot:scaffold306817_cov67-Attheya_sp.AAC.7
MVVACWCCLVLLLDPHNRLAAMRMACTWVMSCFSVSLRSGPWLVIFWWHWWWCVKGDAIVIAWGAEVVGSSIKIVGIKFDGCGGGGVWMGWWTGRRWWQVTLGDGARLVVMWVWMGWWGVTLAVRRNEGVDEYMLESKIFLGWWIS